MFEYISYGHLGCISGARILTKLELGNNQPIRCTPYRAGPKAHEFEKAENDKMLKKRVIDPAETE